MIFRTFVIGTLGILLNSLYFANPGFAVETQLATVQLDRSVEDLKRGAETTIKRCLTCHGIKYIRYRHLSSLRFSEQALSDIRAGKPLEARLLSTISSEQLSIAFGTLPPDLSLITKARSEGADYLYALLTGYYKTPSGNTENHVFPGIHMPDVLDYANVTDSKDRAMLEKQAKAITAFLEWTADPHAAERYQLGYFVLAYLVFLTLLLYFIKLKVWRRLE